MITTEELRVARTPSELRTFVDSKYPLIMACEDERFKAREKRGIYRWYRDEIMPLADFSYALFDDDVKVKPINGNQGYDAEVYDTKGRLINRIELCVPHDGNYDFKQAKKLNSKRYGDTWCGSPGYEIGKLSDVIVKSARNKSQKDYSDCMLAIVIKCPPICEEFRHEYLDVLNKLHEKLSQFIYKCNGVYLFCNSVGYLKKLQS